MNTSHRAPPAISANARSTGHRRSGDIGRPRVVSHLRSTGTDGFAHLIASLRKGLNKSDYLEGRNVAIESRFAENHPERLPALTAELIDRQRPS